ncbi:MAG: Gx transporter family protein [Eubacteriales bacterium]
MTKQANFIATGAVLTALALIFSYVDSQVSLVIPIPSVKLGLANGVILVALYHLNTPTALTVNLLRIFLANLLFGSPVSAAYGLTGGLLSFAVMVLLKKTGKFSPVGISMAGAVAHIWGQLAIAVVITQTPAVLQMAPPLMGVSIATGAALGLLTMAVQKRLRITG